MASERLALSLLLLTLSTLFSPSLSLTCSSQKLSSNKLYQNCNDLSTLSLYIHWTYTVANKTLIIAFVAPSASNSGWISWEINPSGTGMVGAQAVVFNCGGEIGFHGCGAPCVGVLREDETYLEGKLDFKLQYFYGFS